MSDCKSFISEGHKKGIWPVLIAVWATFLVYSAIAAPVPGVGEPHYLSKAKHFWQLDWCEPDFFLASPNAHTIFYATIGSLTWRLPFAQAAWIGRILVYFLLALGWTQSLSQVLCTRWGSLWSAWIFLMFASLGNFSGEWLVGGVEGKVASYGFLLIAFSEVLRQRFSLAALWAGLAVSFHPVVGMWGVLAYAFSCVVRYSNAALRLRVASSSVTSVQQDEYRSRGKSKLPDISRVHRDGRGMWVSLLILVLFSLPGLVPVLQLLTESVSNETRYAATYLQVYYRLAHHLDPMVFPARSYVCYLFLMVLWAFSLAWGGRTVAKSRLDGIVFGSIVFAAIGIVVGWGPRPANLMPYFAERMQLLKFYPFRLADVLLPIAVAVSLVGVLERTILARPHSKDAKGIVWSPHWLLLILFLAALWHSHSTLSHNRYSREDREDWLDVCAWIDDHLHTNALVQSPTNGWAFKWFARRAEYVTFKDCPQDATGMVEWNRRLNFLRKWFEANYADEFYSNKELKDLREKTGITHLLTDRLGPLELQPIYRNKTFQVYDLESLD